MTLTTAGATAMTDEPTPVPRTLADLRHAAGLTHKQVAERMGVHHKRIGQIEASYPSVNYDTLTRYIQAIGGSIQFTVGTAHVYADQLIEDPTRAGTREYLTDRKRKRGTFIYVPVSATKELPLQEETAQPGDDDTGGQENQADAKGNQGDGGQAEQR